MGKFLQIEIGSCSLGKNNMRRIEGQPEKGQVQIPGFIVDRVLEYANKEIDMEIEYPASIILLLLAAHSQTTRHGEGNRLKDDGEISALLNTYIKKYPHFSAWVDEIEMKISQYLPWKRISYPSRLSLKIEAPNLDSKSSFMVGLDGPNGVGKTTVSRLAIEEITRHGYQAIVVPREVHAANFSHQLLRGQFNAESTHSKYWDSLTETFITSAAIYHHYTYDVPIGGIGFFDRGEASHYVYNTYNLTIEYPAFSDVAAFELIDTLLKMYKHNDLSVFLCAPKETILERLAVSGGLVPPDFQLAISKLNKLYLLFLNRIGQKGVIVNARMPLEDVVDQVTGLVIAKYDQED